MDKYQERYLEHIENKLNRKQQKHYYTNKEAFYEVVRNRKSVRRFNNNEITENIYGLLDYAILTAPSSCNRKGIYYEEMLPEYAEAVLVGGKNWVYKANKVFFLYGSKTCYKNPKEILYMPYLDGGVVIQNICLMCEIENIGCCFINPNLKEELTNTDYFIGAIAMGNYNE